MASASLTLFDPATGNTLSGPSYSAYDKRGPVQIYGIVHYSNFDQYGKIPNLYYGENIVDGSVAPGGLSPSSFSVGGIGLNDYFGQPGQYANGNHIAFVRLHFIDGTTLDSSTASFTTVPTPTLTVTGYPTRTPEQTSARNAWWARYTASLRPSQRAVSGIHGQRIGLNLWSWPLVTKVLGVRKVPTQIIYPTKATRPSSTSYAVKVA